jgi:ribosomal protein S24E
MNAEAETPKTESNSTTTTAQAPVKPTNPAAVRKAIALGKDMRKQPDTSKADVARKMFETIADEPREVIVQAFVDGAGLTPKGAQTYFYNCRRRAEKAAERQS